MFHRYTGFEDGDDPVFVTDEYDRIKLQTPVHLDEDGQSEVEQFKHTLLMNIDIYSSLPDGVDDPSDLQDFLVVDVDADTMEILDQTSEFLFIAYQQLDLPVVFRTLEMSKDTLYDSIDYSSFNIPDCLILKDKLHTLKQAVLRENRLKENYILVTSAKAINGECRHNIVHGVYRFLAARDLNLPIYYKYSSKTRNQIRLETFICN